MMHQVKSYLRWLPASFRLHGIHSPQIFELHRECLLGEIDAEAREALSRFRESVYSDHSTITIEDHGAGSRVFPDSNRKISKMAKTAGSTQKRTELLYRICQHHQPKSILELGTSVGLATHAMCTALPHTKITSVEGSAAVHKTAAKHLREAGIKNVELVNMTFHKYLDQPDLPNFELIFIDGHHQGDATQIYWQKCLELATENTLFIFDDIYWSADMTEAWQQITQHPRATAVVDTFFWGLVFINPKLHKQVYHVRV